MKLHLPTRLRAAVLACFAVVTSFSTTLATGAIVGGAFAVAIAGSQALAAYDATNAILSGSDNPGIFGTASNQTPVTVPDGKTLTFAMENTNTTNWFVNSTYNADILIDGGDDGSTGMCITNGGSGTMTFAGSVTGDGLLSKTGAGTDMTLAFTGNVSNFSGGIDLGSTSDRFVLRFSSTNVSSSEKGVSGIGDISFKTAKNTLEYNYSGGNTVYVTNAIAKNGGTSKVKLSGTDAVVFTKSVAIDELTSSASSITFAGGSATLIGTFNLANAALGTAPAVQGTGEFNLANNILVELGDVSRLQLNQEYVVFGEDITVSGWDSLTIDRFIVQGVRIGSRTQYTLSEKGITFTDYGAVYTDMSTAGTQNWNYTDAVWNTAQDSSDSPIAFAAGDSAVFTADAVLTVQNAGVEVTGLTVSGEGTEVSLTGGYIVVRDEVVVGNGAKLLLNTKTNDTGYLRGEVTVENGGTLQFNAKDVTGYTNNNTHTININEGGKLVMNIQDTANGVNETFRGTLNLDGTLEGNGRWDLYGGSAKIVTGDGKNASISTNLQLRQNDSAITVGSNSTLTVSGTFNCNEGNGKLIKNGAGSLLISGAVSVRDVKLTGGSLTFENGGSMGAIELAANNTNLVFGGEGKTYTTGAISTTTNNYFARNIRVDSGVTVTVAANSDGRALVNSWGMGVLTVDGTLNLEGNLYMHTGGNNSTTNNLITGTGVVNAASLTTSNGGTYNFSVNALNVSGYAEFGQYTNFLGGTANLNGTSGFYIRTNIEGGTLNLVGAFKSNNNGVINVNSGALNFKGVTAEGFDNTLQVLNVAKGAAVTVDTGAVATIASATIAAPIVNKGNLTLSGTLTVSDLSGFTPVVSGSLTYVDAEGNPSENGYLSGERAYTLIENTGTLNDDAITTVSGATGTYADGVLTMSATDETVYYVNTTVDAVALGTGKKYCINGGTLNVGTDAANILATATGETGIMKITASGMHTNNANLTTAFEGTLELASGIAFTLGKAEAGGGGDGKVIDVDSFSSVVLNNGSTLNYQGNGNTTIKNFTVKEGTANLHYIDANGDNAVQMAGVTKLDGNLSLSTQFDGAIAFERLTGAGNLTSVASSGEGEEFSLSIQSLQGYKGAISLTKGGATYDATISTGATEAVSFKGISVTNAAAVTWNIQSATTMSEGLSLNNGANVTLAVASGGSLSGAVNVTGAGNTLTSSAGAVNLSRLNVAANAALDLNGSVSALLMNQAGTVDIAGMSLTDGAVLTYGNAANLLNVTDSMLAGNVVIGTGLTLTTEGVNLGLSSAIDVNKIGISNYDDSELRVVGDTWHLKLKDIDPNSLERYYWESASDTYWVSGKWSLTDDDTANFVSLPDNMRRVVLVYSGAGTEGSPNLMKLNNPKSVYGVEVVGGYYRFMTEDGNGKITCAGDLVIGENGHLVMDLAMEAANLSMASDSEIAINKAFTNNGQIKVTGSGAAIKLGNGQNMTAGTLNLSTAGASLSLSGAGNANSTNTVTLSSINLGEDSEFTLKAGTSDLTAVVSGLTLAANSTISLEAGQVLDLTAIDTMDDEDTGKFSSLLNATSGAGVLKVSMPGEFRMKTDTSVSTNVETAQLKINSYGTGGKTLTIGAAGSLDLSGKLILQSTAKAVVSGGSVTASKIELGHSTAGNPGHLEMTAGSITTEGFVHYNADNTFTMSGGVLDISTGTGISTGIVTTITGGTLKASGADGWGVTGASVGGATVSADSAGKVTLNNTSVTGDITGNDKLVMSGTLNATAAATVSDASVGGVTVNADSAGKVTLADTTVTGDITGNDKLVMSGALNATADATVSNAAVGGVTVDAAGSQVTLADTTVTGNITGNEKLVMSGTLNATAAATVSDASVGGVTVDAGSAGKVTLADTTVTGDITGNDKLVMIGALNATAAATVSGASVGGVTVDAAGSQLTLTNTTVTDDIIGNNKLVLSGTVGTTAASTVSAASVGGITLTATEANKLTLNNTTIGSAITNTNNGALVFSGTQNVTLDGANTTHYADVYGSSTFGANGYKSLQDVYTLVSGANATAASDTIWQIDGETVVSSETLNVIFNGKELSVIHTADTAGKVYYINSDTVEYKTGAGCSAAEKLQLVGGKLVMSKELDTAVTTGGISVTGSSTTLELKAELAADKLSLGTGAATVLMGNGTLNLGTGTSLASGITMGTATDAKWTGAMKVSGAALTDANLSALGISGSTIELDDTDGSLKGGTYAAAVLLSNGSELTLGADNTFNGGLDATNGTLKIAGKNSISTLTLADSATLGIDLTSMGLDSLLNMGDEALLTIGTLNAGTAGGALNLSALISADLLLTMSNGQSITLADIATNNATLGLLLDDGSGATSNTLELKDDNGYLYTYTLAQDDTTGHTVVKVSAKLYQNGWIGDETDVWTTTDSLAGADANWEGSIGLFAGYGSGTVNIDAAGVDASAKTVMVSAAEHTTDYTFEGGALVADKLVVNAGSLTINNEGMETLSTTVVSGKGSLSVNTGKELTVGTDMAVLNEAKFTNKGETTIIGTLTVAQDATVTNSRNLSVGGVSAEEATISSTGQLTIGADGGTIGALTGNGYLNNSGELTIKSDTDLQTLTNAGTLTVEGALKVTATATGGVIKAASADLGYAKLVELQVSGAVTAKELTVDKATMESLTADKLASLAGDTVTVTNDASLGTFSVNGVLEVGGKLTVSDAVESEGEILAAEADLQSDATLDTLKVTGGLKATNLSVTTLEAASLDAESLTITDGGTGTVQSGVTLDKFSGSGSFSVLGDLTVNSTVAQGGTVQADNITVAGSAVFADVTTGSLTADAVSLTNGSITTLNTEHLTVHGTVSVTDDVSLASLGGTGTLQVDNKLSLTEQITSSANVAAGILELQASGSTLGSVLADTLAVAEGLTLSTTDALLTVDAFDVLNASEVAISLSESVFAALDKEASGLYSIADYLIIDGVASADIFNLTDCAGLDALRAAGRDATLSVSKGNLYLSITAAMDEEGEEIGLVWDATGGNTTTSTGSEIDTEDGFYKALDYVQQVLVKDDTTFDLTTDAVGDAEPGNTSKPELGLTVRNLRGGGELTIKGNSAAQDVASLFNTDGKVTSAAEAVGLTVDAARVNLGLPADSDGIMDDDFGAESPTLASLSLVNGALVDVNADTEVLGDTDLADTSALQVAEGSILTTHMLSGTDKASVSGAIRVTKGGVYTGSGEDAEIIASGGSDLRLRTGGRKGMSLLAENGSKVTLDSAGQDGSMKSLRVGGPSMARMAGASTLNLLNTTTTDKGIVHNTLSLTDTEGNYISNAAVTLSLGLAETAGTLGTADAPVVIDGAADVTGSSITVNMLGNGVKNGVLDIATGDVANLKLAQLVTGGTVDGNSVVLTGTPEMQTLLAKYYTNARLDKSGAITVDRVTDYYSSNLKLSENAQTGAAMADVALLQVNPQANPDKYKDLAGVLDSLDDAVVAGNNAAADSLGAAVSGASVAALGAAVAGDVERQLMAIRNRTTTMGVDQNSPNLDMPYFNAWINAEGDFRRMDEDGTAAGYELNSWGGTVGFDVDISKNLTAGLAATAMYGDFTAKSADHAEGDMDTYYLTTFARFAAHRWSHTFVATVGMADTSLKRTVAHANGSYSAEGDTDALSFGFLYEVGYVAAMNESATACLQPVFNVMLSHSCLNGYKETGSDAALSTGDVEMTTVTFGLGARTQAQVGTGTLNRATLLEGRALVKLRAGDREAEAENALGLIPGATGSVVGAEKSVVGMELGVGITIPVGSDSGSVFADASLEVGGGYTNINGTVGYRINF